MSSRRSSTRLKSSSSTINNNEEYAALNKDIAPIIPTEEKTKSTTKKRAPSNKPAAVDPDKKKAVTKRKSPTDDEANDKVVPPTTAAAADDVKEKKKKVVTHQQWTEMTPLTRLWDPIVTENSRPFTVVSWNVAGLRALVKNRPDAIPDLCRRTNADVLCLQETKLQVENMEDKKLKLREYFNFFMVDYDCYWSYSLEKKGYSGTAMFIRRGAGEGSKGKKQSKLGEFFTSSANDDSATTADSKTKGTNDPFPFSPINVKTELGLPEHDGEGRTITAEFPFFFLTNVYVPNSGQKLERLDYRTNHWDIDFLTKMKQLESDGNKPVIWLGDLNVAHTEKDTWNEGAKHLAKSAGTTAEERASFDVQLGAGYVDVFRGLHPDARGHYSYWSQRAGNREPNKGLRLDYFICSKGLMEDGDKNMAIVRDSYMIPDVLGSDHCPIVLEIEIRK
jgi:exodeoxyribonuclease-3